MIKNKWCNEDNPKWKGGKIAIECQYCKKIIYVYKYKKDQKYCSVLCMGFAYKKEYPKCQNCGIKLKDFRSKHCKKCFQSGYLNHNWKGGLRTENEIVRASIEYKNWRQFIFERDDYTCQMCNNKGKYLEAHHIKKFNNFPELRFDLNNGITLCKNCHDKTKKHEEEYENQFMSIINSKVLV